MYVYLHIYVYSCIYIYSNKGLSVPHIYEKFRLYTLPSYCPVVDFILTSAVGNVQYS